MKKSDIKNGMHVITKDGTEYVVISGVEALGQTDIVDVIMVQLNESGWMPLDDYDDDLRYHSYDDDDYDFNIEAIYTPRYYAWTFSSIHDKTYDNEDKFIKIWERSIAKKMTKADIEKELGYEIEIVK